MSLKRLWKKKTKSKAKKAAAKRDVFEAKPKKEEKEEAKASTSKSEEEDKAPKVVKGKEIGHDTYMDDDGFIAKEFVFNLIDLPLLFLDLQDPAFGFLQPHLKFGQLDSLAVNRHEAVDPCDARVDFDTSCYKK
ncbi:hypothetical protein L596_019553 [Steinernema carpocapsae]|uniref:Uncharacterized protein n=1 Tax=Steinernema carpocapsae TaxID=34508 RepID=A0A4U5MQV3_STECR|nr:hypothetical protein L596_019553 [Steinernema carpocapsae]